MTRRSRRAYRAGVQGTLAIFSHFIYTTNTNPPSPQPQLVPLHRKRADALPLASHSTPNTSPTHQHVPHNPNTRMCPCGHVLVFPLPSLVSNTRTRPCGRVLVFGSYFLPPGHEERDPSVAFFVSGMVLHTPDMKTRPQCRVFVSGITLRPSHHPLPPRHEERNHMVAFFVSGMLLTPHGSPLVPHPPNMQNTPTRACFLCSAPPLSSLTHRTCKTRPGGACFVCSARLASPLVPHAPPLSSRTPLLSLTRRTSNTGPWGACI